MDSDEISARDALETNRTDKWWCLKCCRPRSRNYCPASARNKTEKHNLVRRSSLTFEQQLEFYLVRGHGAFRGER